MPYHHFTSDERDALQVLLDKGLEKALISRILSKHNSSIYREIERNNEMGVYLSRTADAASLARRARPRTRPKRDNAPLIELIESRIREDHSPEQIAGRLRLEYPNDPTMQISHETIYLHLYEKIRNGSEDLRSHLRQNRKKRRKRLSCKDRRGIIPYRHFIDERPAIVEKKKRIGDWEGDTVEGMAKKGYVATFVDRASKYLIAFPLRHKTAQSLRWETSKAFSKLPAELRKTITVDNGKEFAEHRILSRVLNTQIFFAHPYHSWERGLNEHTNGLLRQYLPKGLRLDRLTKSQLAFYVSRINNRPRKSLGYRTPWEVFFEACFALRI